MWVEGIGIVFREKQITAFRDVCLLFFASRVQRWKSEFKDIWELVDTLFDETTLVHYLIRDQIVKEEAKLFYVLEHRMKGKNESIDDKLLKSILWNFIIEICQGTLKINKDGKLEILPDVTSPHSETWRRVLAWIEDLWLDFWPDPQEVELEGLRAENSRLNTLVNELELRMKERLNQLVFKNGWVS